jgi:hypothetical protein
MKRMALNAVEILRDEGLAFTVPPPRHLRQPQAPSSGCSPAPLGTTWGPHSIHAAEQPAGGHPSCAPG